MSGSCNRPGGASPSCTPRASAAATSEPRPENWTRFASLPALGFVVLVEDGDPLAADLDAAAAQQVANGARTVRGVMLGVRRAGICARNVPLAAAAHLALTAAGIAVRRGRPVRAQPGVLSKPGPDLLRSMVTE